MRGKVPDRAEKFPDPGITPAYAGKSTKVVPEMDAWRDHPRLCGEKPLVLQLDAVTVGSPPPMRGKVMCKNIVR